MTDIALGHVDSAPVHRDVAVAVRPETAPEPDPDPWRKPGVTHPLPRRPNPRRELHLVEPVRANSLSETCGFVGAGRKR